MLEGYAQQGRALADPINKDYANATAPSLAIIDLCSRLEKHLSAIAEGVQRTQQFSHRLLDPKPEKARDGQGVPPAPSTVEGKLRYLNHLAERIGQELHSVVGDLDRAA